MAMEFFLGMVIFSLTLPATRITVTDFDPVVVGLGRAIVAAVLSLILAEGAILSRTFSSWQVTCWALILSVSYHESSYLPSTSK